MEILLWCKSSRKAPRALLRPHNKKIPSWGFSYCAELLTLARTYFEQND